MIAIQYNGVVSLSIWINVNAKLINLNLSIMNPFYTVSFHFSKVTWMNAAHEYDVIVMQFIKDKEMILEFFKKVKRQSWKWQIMTEITK